MGHKLPRYRFEEIPRLCSGSVQLNNFVAQNYSLTDKDNYYLD